MSDDYRIQVYGKLEDPAWDAFVAATPGGQHVQTSLWAQVKASLTWRAIRVIAYQKEQIVGGAQLLVRAVSPAGQIGYVTNGPLLASNDPELSRLILGKLCQISRKQRLWMLIVQPPAGGVDLAASLRGKKFLPCPVSPASTASCLIDLTQPTSTILAHMNAKTRHNIRQGVRKCIKIREGTEDDLSTFHRLLMQTAERQNFTPYSLDYYKLMWRKFHPHNFLTLLIAECEGEATSALIVIPFRDTVLAKSSGWSGTHNESRPNEAIHWAAIEWGKAHGYHYYDFGGIDREVAEMSLAGRLDGGPNKQTVTLFKLGFGGAVTLFPEATIYIFPPPARWMFAGLLKLAVYQPNLMRTLNRRRTLGGSIF